MEKERALVISKGLKGLDAAGGPKGRPSFRSLSWLKSFLESAGLKVDYVECVDAETLEPRKKVAKGCCVLVAVYCGKTRLIDNRVF